MAGDHWSVLRPGDNIIYEGDEHQIIGIAGTSVRLRSIDGTQQVVLASFLTGAHDFEVIGSQTETTVEPLGVLDGLPEKAIAEAREWERHIFEVETGLPSNSFQDTTPKPEYDPQVTSLMGRAKSKAAELNVSTRTIDNRRARYAKQGLWGLIDRRVTRAWEATGRVDIRLVTVILELLNAETDASTGTKSRLINRAIRETDSRHGHGEVPLPGRSTLYKLVSYLASGRHTFSSAVTRRQTANRPQKTFTPTFASRPGEQVQIDSTPIDVMVVLDSGQPVRADLTIVVDVATRTIAAALLRPIGTKAVDAAQLLARMLVPEPMRPGWADSIRMSASRLPHARLANIDERMQQSAAKPVIIPDTIVIDGGKVFLSETFTRACSRLGISIQRARPRTPTDKAIVETTFNAINTLFCQYVAGYAGRNIDRRGSKIEDAATWTVIELQELLDEWIIAGWQERPHDTLRDPFRPKHSLSPNEKYASLVAASGYLPLPLSSEDYLELLPTIWRHINDWGIRIDYRTYDCTDLIPFRRQASGNTIRGGRWEIKFDSYDVSRIFLRAGEGWITVPWIHQPLVNAPFADFTWKHARQLAGEPKNNLREESIARVLKDLLTRAEASGDIRTARVIGRDQTVRSSSSQPYQDNANVSGVQEHDEPEADDLDKFESDEIVPLGVFDPLEDYQWLHPISMTTVNYR